MLTGDHSTGGVHAGHVAGQHPSPTAQAMDHLATRAALLVQSISPTAQANIASTSMAPVPAQSPSPIADARKSMPSIVGVRPRSPRSKQPGANGKAQPTQEMRSAAPSTKQRTSNRKAPNLVVSAASTIGDTTQATERTTTRAFLPALVSAIRELHRRRTDFLNAEGSLGRQVDALGRRMGRGTHPSNVEPEEWEARAARFTDAQVDQATWHLRVSSRYLRRQRSRVERELTAHAERLPVFAAFVEPLCGFGALGFAQIVGEAGDLSNYANPAKLWKRMGLGLVNGERQRKCTDAEKAAAHGYSPRRRSIMFVIGDSLLKKQNAYRELYLARKEYEQTKVPDGTKMLWHRRAQRYVEKRLLRDLWRAWRDQVDHGTHTCSVAPTPAATGHQA